jgi:hypothetical protein
MPRTRGLRPPVTDPDPSTVVGLVYRIFSRWRIMLGAVIAVLVLVGIVVLISHLVGPVRVEIGPVGVEPVSVASSGSETAGDPAELGHR